MKVIDLELRDVGDVILTIKKVKNGKPFIVRLYNEDAIRVFTNVKDLIEIVTNDINREAKNNDRHNRSRIR